MSTSASTSQADVVVVGAGITGLATAWMLDRAGADVVLVEASERVGGKVCSGRLAGQLVELGADALLARNPAGARLVTAAGLGDDLVEPATGQAWLWVGERLRPLPSGTVLGAPTDLVAIARSGVLPPATLLRAGLDAVLPRRVVAGDRSVADLVAERFGAGVVERLVEPLLGGVYAGRADQLSVEATAPQLAEAARTHRSLLAGLRAGRRAAASAGPVFQALSGGLGTLTDRLAGDLGAKLHAGCRVEAVEGDGRRWFVHAEAASFDAGRVVLATPAHVTAELVAGTAPDVAAEVGMIPYASVAVVTLAYPRSADRELPDGSGMLVPRGEGRLVKASTWVTRKWPHLDAGDHVLIRSSVGRIDDERWRDLDDRELVERVDAETRLATGISTPCADAVVTRWERALPQYLVGHRERVDRIRMRLPSGVDVAGAAYDGIGISPCIASAERAVASIVA